MHSSGHLGGGGGVCLDTPPDQTQADSPLGIPPWQTSPLVDTLPGKHPLADTPLCYSLYIPHPLYTTPHPTP